MQNLNRSDRCDRCIAQAYHVANKGGFELFFCNHHFKPHESALLEQGWEIVSDVLQSEPVPAGVLV